MPQVTDVVNVLRPDEVRPSSPGDEALTGAPAREDGYFKVKAICEEEAGRNRRAARCVV